VIPSLHVTTDDATLARGGFVDRAREVLEAGGPQVALHVRGPGSSGREIFRIARELAGPAERAGALLLVNDRVDVARLLGLGVHLGRRSLPPAAARRLLDSGCVVGLSAHSVEEGVEGERDGVDFLFLGPVFPTPSHPESPGVGVDVLRAAAGRLHTPVMAIGGVGLDRIAEVLEAGARGVAVIRAVWEAPDPAAAVEELVAALAGGPGGT